MLKHEKRFFATLIDIAIVLTLTLVISLFVHTRAFLGDFVFLLIYFIVGFTYTFLSLIITKGYTIGLFSLSLKLLQKNWDKPSKRSIVLRALLQGVPVLYLVNILYMLLNKTEITFFDELTETIVVQTGSNYNIANDSKEKETSHK